MADQHQSQTHADLLRDLGYPIVDGLPTALKDSPSALPTSVDLAILSGLFVACLVCFHLLLVRRLRLSNLAWKYVDYIWLPLALLGMLGSTASVRTSLAESAARLDPSERLLLFWISRESRAAYDRLNCAYVQDPKSALDAAVDTTVSSYCLWLLQMEFASSDDAVENFYVKHQQRTIFPTPPSNTQNLSGYDALSRMRARVIDLTSLRFDNLHRTRLPNFWIGLMNIGPLLVVVALALRITRVSGEIANERKAR